MKHFTLMALAMLAAVALNAQAKTKITFAVDMNKQTVGPKGVHIAGDFQKDAGMPGDWDPGAAAGALADADKDGIYTVTYDLPQGKTYGYKFINGDAWGTDEPVPGACAGAGGNRSVTVGTAAATFQNCFGACEVKCVAVKDVKVTFKVNMKSETISPDGVHLAGDFQGFNPGSTKMQDDDRDGIYEVTLTMKNGAYGYKFINGNAWGKDESVPCSCIKGNNREVVVPFTDDLVVVPAVCFRACSNTCLSTDNAEVTFRVDMSGEAIQTSGLFVAGSFQKPDQWQKNVIKLTDPDNDGIYTAKIAAQKIEHQYKFFNGDFTKHPSNVGKDVKDMNSDIYAEGFDFTAGKCGCGNFKNRIFDAGSFTTTGVLPVFVYNSCERVSVGTNDLTTAANIRLFPNPMGQNAYLEFDGNASEHTAVIADQLGRVVRTYASFSGNQLQIQKGDLSGGLYFVTLQNEKGERATVRLAVQ